ncbi:MAG: hypothetical protein AAF722_01555 [Cyanobacteria bacterium P01_C01_bin.70]
MSRAAAARVERGVTGYSFWPLLIKTIKAADQVIHAAGNLVLSYWRLPGADMDSLSA